MTTITMDQYDGPSEQDRRKYLELVKQDRALNEQLEEVSLLNQLKSYITKEITSALKKAITSPLGYLITVIVGILSYKLISVLVSTAKILAVVFGVVKLFPFVRWAI